MGDNKTTEVYSTTTDIRPVCRRATSVYIDISVQKRAQTDVRLEPKQSENIFRYPMLAHKDSRNSQLMWKRQWDEVKVWNVTGRLWEVLWQWMVECALSFVSLPRQQWCASYFPLYNTSHFTEMSKELWTCPSNSITYSQAKFTLMCSHVRSNIFNFKPRFKRIRHVLKKPEAPGHEGNWTGMKTCEL
jgi:hypothetical protein